MRRPPLRRSLEQLAHDFAEGVLRAIHGAPFAELWALHDPVELRRRDRRASAPSGATPIDALAKLTPSEREIFDRVLQGSSNADVARDLRLSIKTVQTHRAKVNAKLGFHSGPELVRFGALNGLLRHEGAGAVAPHGPDGRPTPLLLNLAEVERKTIATAIRVAGGDRGRAAKLLGLSRSELDAKVRPARPARPPGPSPTR